MDTYFIKLLLHPSQVSDPPYTLSLTEWRGVAVCQFAGVVVATGAARRPVDCQHRHRPACRLLVAAAFIKQLALVGAS